MIEARILKDSIGAEGSAPRLLTFMVNMPRFILAEWNTHRAFSRNAASSRAIPVPKRMQMVMTEPVIPIEWGLDQPGMQSKVIAPPEVADEATRIWLSARDYAVSHAQQLMGLGISKQIVNRLLEPFVYVQVLMTCVMEPGLENFFALRWDDKPDPHMIDLATKMAACANASTPEVLLPGEWHIPFSEDMYPGIDKDTLMKVLVARAARLSFNNFDGTRRLEDDVAMHDRLARDGHWSSFEHCAQVPEHDKYAPGGDYTQNIGLKQGNLPGWVQLRKLYPTECRKDSRIKKWIHRDGLLMGVEVTQ